MEEEPDSGSDSVLKSHPLIDNDVDDKQLVQLLAQDLRNLILSCTHNEQQHSLVAINSQAVDEEVEVDPNEVRVLEEREAGEIEIICESNEIGGYENNNNNDNEEEEEEIRVEDVEDMENESLSVGKSKGYHYPLRLDAEDCAYYIRTGMCKFGSNCKFNHPIRRKNQHTKETKKHKEENGQTDRKPTKEPKKQKEENVERQGQTERKPIKETKKQKEENVERQGQTECKYYTSSTGCKLGKACKFNHGIRKTVKTPVAEYNFVGLPIRPGEKECPYYMRHGSCKYSQTCRFNHPDPTAVGGSDSPTTVPLQPTPQPNIPNMSSWSTPRPPVMYPPTQTMAPPNPDWNVYQSPASVPAHLYPSSEQGLPIPPAFFLNNPPSNNTSMYTHHQQQQHQQQPPMLVSEYPERPGQPDCGHFMKTGVCKYRASCKYNHPPSRLTRTSKDQNVCTYFSRHGTCKYGSACKYDHPVNYNSNPNAAGEGYDWSNGPGSVFQQSG